MTLRDKHIGIALTGSFCTFHLLFEQIERLLEQQARVTAIFSECAQSTDTRFGKAADFLRKAEQLTGNKPITNIVDAEPLGPQNILDILAIAPCTGNTLAKMANAITDSTVLMAAKGLLRNNKPVVIAVSSNDALSNNLQNIGLLLNKKQLFFVPFGQDNYAAKPNSMVADFSLLIPTLQQALDSKQLQPLLLPPK